MLDEAAAPGSSVSEVARRYGVSPSLLFRWRRPMDECSLAGLDAGENVVPQSEARQLQAQVRELERLLGRKTLENEVLRDAVRLAREKNCSCGRPRPRRTRREDGQRRARRVTFEPDRAADGGAEAEGEEPKVRHARSTHSAAVRQARGCVLLMH